MNTGFSKSIKKNDDSSKDFIMKVLEGEETHGFDIDSIYFCDGKWIVLEFLKCESDFVSPHTSHPKRYPWNWKKFVSLFNVAQQLNGELYLVNYSDRDKDSNEVRLMKVSGINYELLNNYIQEGVLRKELDYLIIENDLKMSYDEFKQWYKNLNRQAGK